MKKRNQIDLYRLIFMYIVCILHSGALLTKEYPQAFFAGGYIAVEFFFIVSGYYLAEALSKINAKKQCDLSQLGSETFAYTLSRAKRMYPEFLIGFVLTIILDQIIYHGSITNLIKKLRQTGIYEVLLLQCANPYDTQILNVAWYVSALLFATFIMYPFLRCIPDIFKNIIAPLLMCGYILFASSTGSDITIGNLTAYVFVTGGVLRAVAEMAWGTFLYERVQRMKNMIAIHPLSRQKRIIYSLIEYCCFAFVVVGCFAHGNTSWDFTFFIALTIVSFICLAELDLPIRFATEQVLLFCSNFSYALYMSHRRIINLAKMLWPKESYPVRLLFFLIIATVIAFVIMKICDWWRHYRSRSIIPRPDESH